MRSLFLVLTLFSLNASALECGGVSDSVFKNESLKLQELYDGNVFEESLSFHEYPGFPMSFEEFEIKCVKGKFELHNDWLVAKNFKYEQNRVVEAILYAKNDKSTFEKVALFTEEGFKVIVADLYDFTAMDSTLLDAELSSEPGLSIQTYGSNYYDIDLSGFQISTRPKGNGTAQVEGDVLRVEIPSKNLLLLFVVDEYSDEYTGNASQITIKVGPLDESAPLAVLGTFAE